MKERLLVPFRWVWSKRKIVLGILGAFLFIALVFTIGIYKNCSNAPLTFAIPESERALDSAYSTSDLRNESNTYLTIPEWYIVYASEEYANFIKDRGPSGFPYLPALGEYWCSYSHTTILSQKYPLDSGEHFLLWVIGTSFTAEEIAKSAYENTIGRVTEWIGGSQTKEDIFAQRVAAEYGEFLNTIPWYQFPFKTRLGELWSEVPLLGAHPLRKLERRAFLTFEYGFKAAYGALIRKGTAGAYAPEILSTEAIVNTLPSTVLSAHPEITITKKLDATHQLVSLPRYKPFSDLLPTLAKAGVHFVSIAGNHEIVISLESTSTDPLPKTAAQPLFEMPRLDTKVGAPTVRRIFLAVPVHALSETLNTLSKFAAFEHAYDY